MLNFRQYPQLTKVTVNNEVQLSKNSLYDAFSNMQNLQYVEFNHPWVNNMYDTYMNCYNLTSSPACGPNVITMAMAYFECHSLTGNPVCGNNVVSMYHTYTNCCNFTNSPVCGPNVTDMSGTYRSCRNLNECTVNWYAPNIINARNCFYGKNNSRKYNIHVPANSTTFNTMIINNTSSLVGTSITWTNNETCWYNTTYNIYIYPDL